MIALIMATVIHYFPFIDGSYEDVVGGITLELEGEGLVQPAVVNGVGMLQFSGSDTRLNLLGGQTVQEDWSASFRLRLANNDMTGGTTENIYPISFPGMLVWLAKFEEEGVKKISLDINHYGGNGDIAEEFGAMQIEMSLPAGVDYNQFDMHIVITVSQLEGAQIYINTQQGIQGNVESVPYLNLAEEGVHEHAYPAWPAFIGAGRAEWESANVYIGDFALFRGVLTPQNIADMWNSGAHDHFSICGVSSVGPGHLDEGVYFDLCGSPIDIPENKEVKAASGSDALISWDETEL